jgi:hypothetical protein
MDAQFGAAPTNAVPAVQPPKATVADMDAQFASASTTPPASRSVSDLIKASLDQYKQAGQNMLDANNKLANGMVAGMHAVIDKPAEALAGFAGPAMQKLELWRGKSPQEAADAYPNGDQLRARDLATANQLTGSYGGTPQFDLGKLAGQAALTAPMLSNGAGMVRAGAGALSAATEEAAPLVSKGIQGISNFLSGTAGAGSSGVPGAVIRGASRATAGTVGGAAYNALTGAPVGEGGAVGAAINAGGGVVGDVAKGAAKSIAPLLDPETRALVQKAENFGIQLRGPQISNSPFVQYADSTLRGLPAMGYGATDAAVHGQFNKAVAAQIGESATKITPDVMQAAKTRLGATYDAIVPSLAIKPDDSFIERLGSIESEASQTLPDSEQKPISTQINNILNGFKDGQEMPGDYAHNLIKKGSPLDRVMKSSDPNVAHYAGQIREALNDAMQANAPPEIAQQLAQTNAQYKAMKTIEPLVEKSTTGDVSPALLMQQVRKSYGGMAYNGGGDMGDLARIGQRFLKEPGNSGTAPREMIMHALGTAGGLGAVALSPEMGLTHLAAAGGLGGMVAAGRGLKAAMDSPAYYNALMGRDGGQATNWLLQH